MFRYASACFCAIAPVPMIPTRIPIFCQFGYTCVPVNRMWGALALMVISGLLNYVDRSNLSIGAVEIQNELHLSNYQLGILLSAFFWTYALSQLLYVAGWLVDRLNVCWVLAAGVALW